MHNKLKMDINGVKCHLKPTIAAMQDIECELGMSFTKLLSKISSFDMSIEQLTVIVYHGLIAGSGEVPKDEIKVDMEMKGAGSYLTIVDNFLGQVVAPKKPKPKES